jgi:ribonuclease HI
VPRRRYIVKVDGSYHKNKESGIGMVVIDRYKGRYYYNIRTYCKDSFHCERLAIMYALYKIKEMKMDHDVIILSDNKDIIDEFAEQYKNKNIVFKWIPRKQNTTAHHLAKYAARGDMVKVFVPKQILQMLYK